MKASDKESVISLLVDHGVRIGSIAESASAEDYNFAFKSLKNLCPQELEVAFAIPHCSVSLVEDLKVVIGLSKEGIAFDAIDKMPVHIFILLIVPK